MQELDKARFKAMAGPIALASLVERQGGSVTISIAEMEQLEAKFGAMPSVQIEVLDGATTMRLTLIKRKPKKGEQTI